MKIKKVAQTPGYVGTIVDNLESQSSVDALSAKQGKVLNDKINNMSGGSSVEVIDNLTTADATKALAANQGVVLKDLIDNKGAGIAISDTPPTDEKYDFWLDTSIDDNAVTLEDVYSTEEIKTNKIWIDGKPIYRKVVTAPNLTSSGTAVNTVVSVQELNIQDIIKIGGIAKVSNDIIPIPYLMGTQNFITCFYSTASKKFAVYANNLTTSDIKIFLEYTKTTN